MQLIYENGIDRLKDAKDIEAVQKIYDEVLKKMQDFRKDKIKDLAEIDSATNIMQSLEQKFVKACCIKTKDMEGYLKGKKGSVYLDDDGNIYYEDYFIDEEDDGCDGEYDGEEETESEYLTSVSNNPLNITSMHVQLSESGFINGVKFKSPNGFVKYNEEDAENYYDLYAKDFAFAYVLKHVLIDPSISMDKETREKVKKYIIEHFDDIRKNLPLNNSYPEDVAKEVNK